MTAWRYGISLLMFNLISHLLLCSLVRYQVEHSKRNSLPAHVLLCTYQTRLSASNYNYHWKKKYYMTVNDSSTLILTIPLLLHFSLQGQCLSSADGNLMDVAPLEWHALNLAPQRLGYLGNHLCYFCSVPLVLECLRFQKCSTLYFLLCQHGDHLTVFGDEKWFYQWLTDLVENYFAKSSFRCTCKTRLCFNASSEYF